MAAESGLEAGVAAEAVGAVDLAGRVGLGS